jgi:acyl carrier protein
LSPPATTIERLRKIIARDFEIDPQMLQPDIQLMDFSIDSLGVIEIMFAVEEEFSITVPHDARTSIKTLDDLAKYIDRLVSEQHGASKADEGPR